MAKKNAKIRDFFEGKRRQCTLTDYRQLKSKENVRRMKLMISMPLSHTTVHGMPAAFIEEYALMEKESSVANYKKIFAEMEGAKFSIFSTDTIKRCAVRSDGVMLSNFRLVGEGIGDKRTVHLEFTAEIPWSMELRDWCSETQHSDFFSETIPTQMTLEESEEAPEPERSPKRKKDSKQTEFDPKKIEAAAKKGEVIQ